ncbi:MrcB family domain-containing protein [Romboutsia sp. 1001713B170207_170306_H8]|uniref:MrcB family domain-containing protein n=1 Tax=Romboutsia sp. 1001713B170207_170306_H8 TaxID=2787112 RepID=UPI0008209EC6|nr:DUF3578 domain-containing protein [Romboutsia sp. 1001713B170207_170306_H8]SCH49128.1 5-methylcytosine-specific restriction enzyme B [uncultured Clostridium sp.]
MNIHDILNKIMNDYLKKIKEENCNSQSSMYQLVVNETKQIITKDIEQMNIIDMELEVKSSCGKGGWTYNPWIAIFNPKITKTIQEGVYIVYLFSRDMKRVYLTLNQGYTNLQNKLGKKDSKLEMIKKRDYLRSKLNKYDFKDDNNINVEKPEYEEGCIFYKQYNLGSIPSEEALLHDLENMIEIYKEYYYNIFLTNNEAECFFNEMKNTKMSKSYKIPLLYAFYNDGDIKLKINDNDILKSFEQFYKRDEFKDDLSINIDNINYDEQEQKNLLKIAKDNPIKNFLKNTSQYFYEEEELFCLNEVLRPYIKDESFKLKFKEVLETLESLYLRRKIKNVAEPDMINKKYLVECIEKYIKSKGYTYEYNQLSNLYLSLKTKPFVILAGISGTGKSKIVQLLANSLGATSENKQFKTISVRPDYNDSTELIGYKNLNDEFIQGTLTKVIAEASKEENKNKPYFVCLDEMNLARVEYYLSDYLSIIESRKKVDGEIITDNIVDEYKIKLYIPDNLYIIGTVNMDDTTFQFSRKVLDRANTIEFSDVDLENLFPEEIQEEQEALQVDNNFLKTSYLKTIDIEQEYREYAKTINKKIIEINEILKISQKQFAYRVRDEIIFYMIENKKSQLLEDDLAFDYQIMQKILPAIVGSEYSICEVLIKLFNFVCDKKVIEEIDIEEAENYIKNENVRYENSAKKILYMLKGYQNDGYCSYWY